MAVESNRIMSRELTDTILPSQCCKEPGCLSPLGAAALPLAGVRSKSHHSSTSDELCTDAADSLRPKVVDFRAIPRKVDGVQASSGGCC